MSYTIIIARKGGRSVTVKSELIHERRDRKMEPFYWILTFECLTILLLFSFSLVCFPAYWAITYKGWAYTLLILTLLGLWLARVSFRLLGKYIWENTHLNSYLLYEDRIEFIQYDRTNRVKLQDTFLLGQVEQVFIGRYYALYHYAYKKTGWREKQPIAHILPCLHIVYHNRSEQKVVEIPFYELNDMDLWLTKLQELGTSFQAYVGYMNNMSMARRLEVLADPDYAIPLTYNAPLQQDYNELVQQMDQQFNELIRKQEAATASSATTNITSVQSTSPTDQGGNAL